MEYKQTIESYLTEVKGIADSVSVRDITKVVDIINEARLNRKTIYICGNGGSASTASHFACDLVKLGFKVHCLDDNPAVITATTNDDGFNALYLKQIDRIIEKGDVLVCLSVHGGTGQDQAGKWSQNLLAAITFAKEKGAKAIGLVGFDGGVIRKIADASIVVGQSTPQTESWHLHITHLLCLLLKERIK
jgi:D-sedoheptulose 7-phosphate isomerase